MGALIPDFINIFFGIIILIAILYFIFRDRKNPEYKFIPMNKWSYIRRSYLFIIFGLLLIIGPIYFMIDSYILRPAGMKPPFYIFLVLLVSGIALVALGISIYKKMKRNEIKSKKFTDKERASGEALNKIIILRILFIFGSGFAITAFALFTWGSLSIELLQFYISIIGVILFLIFILAVIWIYQKGR